MNRSAPEWPSLLLCTVAPYGQLSNPIMRNQFSQQTHGEAGPGLLNRYARPPAPRPPIAQRATESRICTLGVRHPPPPTHTAAEDPAPIGWWGRDAIHVLSLPPPPIVSTM